MYVDDFGNQLADFLGCLSLTIGHFAEQDIVLKSRRRIILFGIEHLDRVLQFLRQILMEYAARFEDLGLHLFVDMAEAVASRNQFERQRHEARAILLI